MVRRFFSICLFSVFVVFATAGLTRAVNIDPDLELALQSAGPMGEVPVIINLADKIDIPSFVVPFQNESKHSRRTRMIHALKEKADLTQMPLKQFLQFRGAKQITPLWIQNAVVATIPSFVVSELMSFPGIENIELDALIQAPRAAPAVAATPEWNITRINAPTLWSIGIDGTGTVVASLDTGVDVTHPDLQPRWRGGACSIPPDCPSWFDPYTNSTSPYDGSAIGHGTGTMGIMVGDSSGGTAIGVAPGAQWIAAKIFSDAGSAPTSMIHQAFQWVLAPGGDPLNAPDVVSNSWGQSSNVCVTTFQSDIQTLKAAGIAVVFSAGNSGPGASTSVSPANLIGSFAVGATDNTNTIYGFGSRGPTPLDAACGNGSTFPHVVAPGVSIYTTAPSAAYHSLQGTSFSAPHVSGGMALLLSAFPNLTPVEMETALENTAAPLGGAVPNDSYGYGLIDVDAAYHALLPQNPYTITATSENGGTLSPVGVLHVASGENLTIAITPDPGSHIADVFVDTVSICAPNCLAQTSYSFTNIQANHSIAVRFAPTSKTIGLYDPGAMVFYLRNSNTTGAADVTFRYGPRNSTWMPIVGDWNGDGITTVGLYDAVSGTFYLRNSNTAGAADLTFRYGVKNSNWVPVAGDWNGDGITTVGLYDPVGGIFYLRDSNTAGAADLTFRYGPQNSTWIPISGDWNGTGSAKVGLYDPTSGTFYLKNTNTPGAADSIFSMNPSTSTWIPVTGDWNGAP